MSVPHTSEKQQLFEMLVVENVFIKYGIPPDGTEVFQVLEGYRDEIIEFVKDPVAGRQKADQYIDSIKGDVKAMLAELKKSMMYSTISRCAIQAGVKDNEVGMYAQHFIENLRDQNERGIFKDVDKELEDAGFLVSHTSKATH